jgi:hypothetical protein
MFNWIAELGSSWLWLYPLIGFLVASTLYTVWKDDGGLFTFTFLLWPCWFIFGVGYCIYAVFSTWFKLLKWIKNKLSAPRPRTKRKPQPKKMVVVKVSKTRKTKAIMPEGTDKSSRLQALD